MTVAHGNQVRRDLMLGCYVFVLWQVIEDLAERLRHEMGLIVETKLVLRPTKNSNVTSSKGLDGELPDEGEIIQFWINWKWLWEIAEKAAEQYVELAAGPKVVSCGRRIGCLGASSRKCIRGCRLF